VPEFQFESWAAFVAMTPHGAFVWPVYLLGVVVLGGLTWSMALQHQRAIRQIRRNIEREEFDESKA
jgi:heme exporter protein CcmD